MLPGPNKNETYKYIFGSVSETACSAFNENDISITAVNLKLRLSKLKLKLSVFKDSKYITMKDWITSFIQRKELAWI